MTYYHGFQSPQMVFSGFPLWQFQRAQARALGDFVLRDIFGLDRSPTPALAARAMSRPPAPGRSLPLRRP
jgi:hypothetical protein